MKEIHEMSQSAAPKFRWQVALLAALAAFASFLAPVAQAAKTPTSTVLMMPNRDAMINTPVVVWGVSTQNAGANFVLDFGDGSAPVSGTLTANGSSSANTADRSYIAFSKTYTTRGRYTATLVVGSESDTVTIQVFDPGYRMTAESIKQLETNMAIQDGLRYHWTAQNSRAANFPSSIYTNWGSKPSTEAALAALAFQNQGYRLPKDGSEPTGLYERFVVRRAINYVLSTLTTNTLATQNGRDPCVGYGVPTTPFWVAQSQAIATGAVTFTAASGLGYQVGTRVRASDATNPGNYMEGEVTASGATSMSINVDLIGGSGSPASWVIRSASSTSMSVVTIGTGNKTFSAASRGLAFAPGSLVHAFSSATPSNYVEGVVTASSATEVTINATVTGGSAGTVVNDWKLAPVAWTGSDCSGVSTTDGEPGYGQGVEMIALAATGALGRVNTEVTGALQNKTYAEILQRMSNVLIWGMGDSGNGIGTWTYSFNGTSGDGSTIGWAILGLLDAESAGAYVPSWVRPYFLSGFEKILNTTGSIDYTADGYGNSESSPGPEKNGIALQGMYFAGVNSVTVALSTGGTANVSLETARNLITSWWSGSGGLSGNNWSCDVAATKNFGCAYTMFNNFKGLSLQGITSLPSFTSGATTYPAVADWKQEYQDWLIWNQTRSTATTSSAKSIASIQAGTTTVVTSTAHGYPRGARVAITGTTGTGSTLLNDKTLTIQAVTADTFTLAIDTTGKAFNNSAGTATRVTVASTDGGQWGTMGFSCCYTSNTMSASVAQVILSPAALVLPDELLFSSLGPENDQGIDTRLQGATPRQSHTVVATATSSSGSPVAAVSVVFEVLSGPNAGLTDTLNTGADGKATWTYADALPPGSAGVDVIRAKIGSTNSNSVSVTWVSNAPSYTVGGTVNGLKSSQTLTLLNTTSNCGAVSPAVCPTELLDVTGAGGGGAVSFLFPTALPGSAKYTITVEVQPLGQLCSVTANASNSAGTGPFSNVSNVTVTCEDTSYTVGGNVSGLSSGALSLRNTVTKNGVTTTSDRTVLANGPFTFLGLVDKSSDWAVSVVTEPAGHKCTVSSGSGTNIQGPVSTVAVSCVTAALTKLSTDPQSAAATTAVASPPSVKLAFGTTPLVGKTITFTVSGATSTIANGSGSSTATRTVDTDANGVATLTSWTLGAASANATVVTASAPNSVDTGSGTVTGISPVTFTATAYSTASKLSLNAPADIIKGGARAAYTVTLQDANSVAVPAASGGLVVYLSANGSGGLFYPGAAGGSAITSVTIPAGSSSASFYFTGNIATYTVTASDASTPDGATGLADATDSIAVTAGPAALLAFTTQPNGGASQAGWTQQPQVTVRDAFGNTVTASVAPITLVLTSAGGATLACTNNTVSASSGVASFAGCKVDKAGTYTLTAASLGLTSVDSASFTITVGSASKLGFTTQPNGGVTGSVWSTQPVVAVQDAGGNTITTATNSISVVLTTPGSATLTCTATTVSAVAGVASFGGCKVNQTGTYTLTASSSSGGLTNAVSSQFTVTAVASKLAFTVQPGGGAAGLGWANQPTVAVQDAVGNTIVDSSAPITLALTTPGGAVLACTTNSQNAGNGVAVFAGCKVDKAGTYTMTATTPNLTSAVSSQFTITVGAASKLAFTAQPGGNQPGAVWPNQPVVTVQDAGGNTVTGSSALVSLALTNANGAVLTCAATSLLVSSGVATFSGCKVDLGGTYTLTATSPALTSAVSNAITLGVPAKLVFTVQPGGGPWGRPWAIQPVVTLQTDTGATAIGSTLPVTLLIEPLAKSASQAKAATLLGCTENPKNAVNGVATFAGCDTTGVPVGGYTVTATSPGLTSAVSTVVDVNDNNRIPTLSELALALLALMLAAFGLRRRASFT